MYWLLLLLPFAIAFLFGNIKTLTSCLWCLEKKVVENLHILSVKLSGIKKKGILCILTCKTVVLQVFVLLIRINSEILSLLQIVVFCLMKLVCYTIIETIEILNQLFATFSNCRDIIKWFVSSRRKHST